MGKVKQYLYYFLIGLISLFSLTFLPMIGSEIGLSWSVPDTVVGWCVWIGVKLIVSGLNILIFHSFMCQAKLNVKNDPKFIEANEILLRKKQEALPRSPRRWNAEQYGKKGVLIFFSTALATIALTQAILTFDWVSMLTYLFTVTMGIIFGILQMKRAEEYWTDEYYRYAKLIEKKEGGEKNDRN